MSKPKHTSGLTEVRGLDGLTGLADGIGLDDDGLPTAFVLSAHGFAPTADTGILRGLQGIPVLAIIDPWRATTA